MGDWLPPETIERVRTVRSLLQTDRVAIHVTDLPPLAASVLAALTAALAPHADSAGALAGAIDQIADELVVLAWAGSVAGLRHPGVSLLNHARSALPWSSFAIGLQPESFVRPTSAGDELPLAPPPYPIELLVAPEEDADLDWIVDVVAPRSVGWGPADPADAPWRPVVGYDEAGEAVGVPRSVEALAATTLPPDGVPCHGAASRSRPAMPVLRRCRGEHGRPRSSARRRSPLVLSPQRLRRTTMETRPLGEIQHAQGGDVEPDRGPMPPAAVPPPPPIDEPAPLDDPPRSPTPTRPYRMTGSRRS